MDRYPMISAEVLAVSEDEYGPYAKIRLTLARQSVVIRWGLDLLTYRSLADCVRPLQEPNQRSADYHCWLIFDETTETTKMGWLTCEYGGQRLKVSFMCSDLFLANLQWLRDVRHLEDVQHLTWSDWTPTHEHPAARSTQERLTAAQSPVEFSDRPVDRPHRRTRRVQHSARPKNGWLIASMTSAVIIVLALGWVGWRYSQQSAEPSAKLTADTNSAPPRKETAPSGAVNAPSPADVAGDEASHATAHTTSQKPGSSTPASDHSTTSANTIKAPTKPPVKTSQPSTSPKPASKPTGFHEVYEVPKGSVALTFDDGPSPYTAGILKVLADYHVHATFFFISNNAANRPDVVRKAAAEGNVVGNHSVDHKDMSKMSAADTRYEITHAAKVIESITNQPVPLFRPPYGALSSAMKGIVSDEHMAMALWNRDPRDWAASSPADVAHRVLQQSPSGGVFDLHDNKNTLLALPTIIEALQKQHLKFVVLTPPVASAK